MFRPPLTPHAFTKIALSKTISLNYNTGGVLSSEAYMRLWGSDEPFQRTV
jgi:hypothetical protein